MDAFERIDNPPHEKNMNTAKSSKVSVIISCFNEEDTIEECLCRLVTALPDAEIIVVHGGHDQTAAKAREIAKNQPNIRVLKNYGDTGKGHAIKIGISVATHEVMAQMDADLQFMPEELPKLLEPIFRGEADITFGARFMPESDVQHYKFSFFRVMGNKTVNRYFSLLTGFKFQDITTGYKAWTREAIEAIQFRDNRFVYEAEIAVKGAMKGFRFLMVPVTYYNRLGGISGHGRGWQETFSIIFTGFKILCFGTLCRMRIIR